MAKRRKSLRLYEHERKALVQFYLDRRIPIDQYEGRPDDLVALTTDFNAATARGELLHYMRTERKLGRWPRLGKDHEKPPKCADLSAEETEILVDIYYQNVAMFDSGSDNVAYSAEIAELIEKEFALATGRFVPAHLLNAKLTALRKRGMLPKAQKPPELGDGFSDIDEVG